MPLFADPRQHGQPTAAAVLFRRGRPEFGAAVDGAHPRLGLQYSYQSTLSETSLGHYENRIITLVIDCGRRNHNHKYAGILTIGVSSRSFTQTKSWFSLQTNTR